MTHSFFLCQWFFSSYLYLPCHLFLLTLLLWNLFQSSAVPHHISVNTRLAVTQSLPRCTSGQVPVAGSQRRACAKIKKRLNPVVVFTARKILTEQRARSTPETKVKREAVGLARQATVRGPQACRGPPKAVKRDKQQWQLARFLVTAGDWRQCTGEGPEEGGERS